MIGRHAATRSKAAKLLAQVEGELHQSDQAEDQLGKHAEHAHGKLTAELARRREHLPSDPAAQDEYLYLLRHQHKARQVAELAASARRKRGGA